MAVGRPHCSHTSAHSPPRCLLLYARLVKGKSLCLTGVGLPRDPLLDHQRGRRSVGRPACSLRHLVSEAGNGGR